MTKSSFIFSLNLGVDCGVYHEFMITPTVISMHSVACADAIAEITLLHCYKRKVPLLCVEFLKDYSKTGSDEEY